MSRGFDEKPELRPNRSESSQGLYNSANKSRELSHRGEQQQNQTRDVRRAVSRDFDRRSYSAIDQNLMPTSRPKFVERSEFDLVPSKPILLTVPRTPPQLSIPPPKMYSKPPPLRVQAPHIPPGPPFMKKQPEPTDFLSLELQAFMQKPQPVMDPSLLETDETACEIISKYSGYVAPKVDVTVFYKNRDMTPSQLSDSIR